VAEFFVFLYMGMGVCAGKLIVNACFVIIELKFLSCRVVQVNLGGGT
jgi:hypothetical protein